MHVKKTKNAKIQYGKKDVLKDSDFKNENINTRISIVIPENIIMKLKKEASENATGYQTLINKILRDYVNGKDSLEKRVEKIEMILKAKKAI